MLPHFGSREVIGHVTIRLAVGSFLQVAHLHQPSISHGFRDMEPQIFQGLWGHDLGRLGSREVISHVAITPQ